MSLHVESPLSDSKMDISEATTSLDSAGISPIADEDAQSRGASPSNHNENAQISTIMDTQNEADANMLAARTAAVQLDNRKIRPEMLPLADQLNQPPSTQRQHIARTLANSHPLMSPTTDSESDVGQAVTIKPTAEKSVSPASEVDDDLKCHNFPDVVPRYEHIQGPAIGIPPPPPQTSSVLARNTLNNMRVKTAGALPAHNKLNLLRAHSPDLLSSESEAEVSQYHATVEANFQAVALVPNQSNGSVTKTGRRAARKLNVGVTAAGCEDISSLDSISNHSFDDDEDLEHNLASLSPSSSLIDGLDDDDDDDDDSDVPDDVDVDVDDFAVATTPTPNGRATVTAGSTTAEQLPQYSAAEERRDSRNWQKITLPDGHTREIDMRVIEPYKRVLSHGGYLKAGGHNAIVIFCACHLPDRSRADYSYVMDNLFLYVIKTLEQLVTEDYVLIYLHGGTSRRNVPPFPWLKKCYQLLDRRLRKSLKSMYLVHPTFWIKSIVWMARPFVSAKFWRKLVYVKSLDELNQHVTVEKAAIPEKVKQYDAKHN